MFQKIDFKGLPQSKLFGYAAEVPFFKGRDSLEFKPGLNILFGPNGCGKSTVLNMLGMTMGAVQGGVSAITMDHISRTVEMMFGLGRLERGESELDDLLGLDVLHDGQPVVFCDAHQVTGMPGGAVDQDFLLQSVKAIVGGKMRSQGQRVLSRSNAALETMAGKREFPSKVSLRVDRKRINESWLAALAMVEARMTGRIPRGQRTILLDEPDANFSLLWQGRLWKLLGDPKVAEDFQVIVASHSAFALAHEGANYIDFEPGYREELEQLMLQRFAR